MRFKRSKLYVASFRWRCSASASLPRRASASAAILVPALIYLLACPPTSSSAPPSSRSSPPCRSRPSSMRWRATPSTSCSPSSAWSAASSAPSSAPYRPEPPRRPPARISRPCSPSRSLLRPIDAAGRALFATVIAGALCARRRDPRGPAATVAAAGARAEVDGGAVDRGDPDRSNFTGASVTVFGVERDAITVSRASPPDVAVTLRASRTVVARRGPDPRHLINRASETFVDVLALRRRPQAARELSTAQLTRFGVGPTTCRSASPASPSPTPPATRAPPGLVPEGSPASQRGDRRRPPWAKRCSGRPWDPANVPTGRYTLTVYSSPATR